MSGHPQKSHLCCVSQPSICSYQDFSGSCLFSCMVSNFQLFWDNKFQGLPLYPASCASCASQICCGCVLLHHKMLEGQMWLILASWQPGHCRTLYYWQVQWAVDSLWTCEYFCWRWWLAYLVVCCNELCNCMKNTRSGEFTRTCHQLKVQLLLCLLLCHLASFLLLFFCLHGLPYWLWNCPMINWYVSLFTPLYILFVMLTNMEVIQWISTFVESLSLSIWFDECFIIPCYVQVRMGLNFRKWVRSEQGLGLSLCAVPPYFCCP